MVDIKDKVKGAGAEIAQLAQQRGVDSAALARIAENAAARPASRQQLFEAIPAARKFDTLNDAQLWAAVQVACERLAKATKPGGGMTGGAGGGGTE